MPQRTSNVHLPQDRSGTALIIVDMISRWDFPGGTRLCAAAKAMAPRLARLRQRCKSRRLPVIYANDNRGRWRSDFRELLQEAEQAGGAGAAIASLLRPDGDDYFVLKPAQSAFHATPLDVLLEFLGVHRLILTGVAGDQCVLASAMDARMRGFEVMVPGDAIASQTAARNRAAVRHFADVLGLPVSPVERIRLPARTERSDA
ncbi:MAG TPA: isochorismatase family cysteine hydrolase [Burkholderiaceae bacterium]|nr:isochorismatase family cysteine hydrolase [Burkholderiaceae bacterium]